MGPGAHLVQTAPMPTYLDRGDAGRRLAEEPALRRAGPDPVVVGLASGGVVVAAEVAAALGAPLDAVATVKVGHPLQPEYALGAVAPGARYLRGPEDLTEAELERVVLAAEARCAALDARLHEAIPALSLAGRTCLLVDDGLATGATMGAAARWARAGRAGRVVAAVPVGAADSLRALAAEVDAVVCPEAPRRFRAVASWYERFAQVEEATVLALLAAATRR
jgi:putative phosphoribosyl transferase